MKWRGNYFLGILNNMQMILIKRGSVETDDSPYKNFDKDFDEVLKLLDSHQLANPRCNIEESRWDANVEELRNAYESLPRHIVNPLFQPNKDSARSPFAPSNVRSENLRRNLFKSPTVKTREILAEEVTEDSPIDHEAAAEEVTDESPSDHEGARESSANSDSGELTKLKERLLKTDAKRSREARGKVVDYIVSNKDVLGHNKCLLCGHEFSLSKNLYKHYRNVNCTKHKNIRKKPENKGRVKPVDSRPTSKPLVRKGRVESAEPQSELEEPIAGPSGINSERAVIRSAEPQSDRGEAIAGPSGVSREIGVFRSAEPQSDEEEDIVETSVIEEDDDAEKNSILTFIFSHPEEINDGDSFPHNQGTERETEDIFEDSIDERERLVEEVGETRQFMNIAYNSNNETVCQTLSAPLLGSSDQQDANIQDHTVLEDVVPDPFLSPIHSVEPEPEKQNRREQSPRFESEAELDYEISPPDFIAKQLPEWRIGEDLPEKIRSVVFSKDPRTLYDTKVQLLTSLENVKPDYLSQDIPEEYMDALEQACGATTETKSHDALSKNKDFTGYVSPDQPNGRIGMRDDFQYIWTVLKRIRGKGKAKKPETIIQYCRLLFGHGSNSLYNFLESRGQKLEEYLYPQGLSSSLSILLDWANDQQNPSTESKKIIIIRGNFMIDIRLYFICLGMRHVALMALYDYFWAKADRLTVPVTDVFKVTSRIEYQRNQVTAYNDASNRANELRPHIQKSARITQQLAENIQPNRYQNIADEIKAYWKTTHYANLIKEIQETRELTTEQFQRISVQLMMICILMNGHRAQIGAFFKRKDLYTLKRHSLLDEKFIMELDK